MCDDAQLHGQNAAVSLIAERAEAKDRAMIEERIYLGHLAHATLMLEEIDRLIAETPERYASLATRIVPLMNIQLAEMSKNSFACRGNMVPWLRQCARESSQDEPAGASGRMI
jgi:hypothetical protein